MIRPPPPALVRPVPFTLALAAAAADLPMVVRTSEPGTAALFLLASSSALAMGILFWMLVLVRGDHGFMARFVGVRKDEDLRLPKFAKILLAVGAATGVSGFAMQGGSRAGIWLFVIGAALAAAASTQYRHGLPD